MRKAINLLQTILLKPFDQLIERSRERQMKEGGVSSDEMRRSLGLVNEKGLKIAEEIDDPLSLVMAYTWLSNIMAFECEFEKGEYYIQKAIEINITANNLWGQAIAKGGISFLGYCPLGNLSLAHETNCEAIKLAEQSGDPYSKSQSYMSRGITFYYKGYFEQALDDLSHACDLASRSDVSPWLARSQRNTGDIYFEKGEYQIAKFHYSNAVSIYERNWVQQSGLSLSKIALARAEAYNGERNIDLESYYELVSKNKLALYQGSIRRLLGDIHLHLNKTIEILKECGADGWVEKYEKELAEL